MSANVSNKFSIKLCDKVFESNEEGFLDLNEIWRGCGLEEKKRPSEWKSSIKQLLINSEKVQIKSGRSGYTIACEEAAIAYGMFVSDEFYMEVIKAFKELRQGNIEAALQHAVNTMSEADAHYLLRQTKIKGMFFDEACAFAGIKHSRLCKKMLLAHPKFNYFDSNDLVDDSELAQKYFYNRGNKFTKNVKLCVTPEGREWLRENRKWFNKAVELYKIETETPFS